MRAQELPVGQNTLQMTKAQDMATTQLLKDIVEQGPATVLGGPPTEVIPTAPLAPASNPVVSCPQYDGNEAECRAKGCWFNAQKKCVIKLGTRPYVR